VAAIALACPASAQAVELGIHGERHGDQTLSRGEVERMRLGRTPAVRTPLSWELVQRGPNASLDFKNFDNLMRWASQDRLPGLPLLPASLPTLEIFPILVGSPGWVNGAKTNNEPPTTASDLRKWQRFVTAAINRYGRAGTFWAQNPFLRHNPITAVQVWNEPNLRTFWTDGDPNAREYARFLDTTGAAIRASTSPDTTIVLAGMPERSDAPRSMAEFLKELYKVSGFKDDFDVVAIHPFARNARGVNGALNRIRKVVDRGGDAGKPMWVTEMGYASAGPKGPFTKSPNGQAKALKKNFGLIGRKAGKYNIEKAFWYSWRDSDSDPPKNKANDRWQTYTGLFTRRGQQKPAWGAFTSLTGGNAGRGNL
jgi:hypothetical protein